jgi:hypothetical protein
MNPETKLVLDALTKRFDDMEARWDKSSAEADEKLQKSIAVADEKWESRFAKSEYHWERQFADLKVAQDARVDALERSATAFEDWRPEVEGTMDDIRTEVGKLSKHWGRSVHGRSPPLLPTAPSAVLPAPAKIVDNNPSVDLQSPSVSARPSAADFTDRPNGHDIHNCNRVDGYVPCPVCLCVLGLRVRARAGVLGPLHSCSDGWWLMAGAGLF